MSISSHLSKFERILPHGTQWKLVTSEWLVLHLREGAVYLLDSKGNREIPMGGITVYPPGSQLTLMASVLGQAVFCGIAIRIESLMGFLTAIERRCLEFEVPRQCTPFIELTAEQPIAKRMAQLFATNSAATLSQRLAFAQAFAELVTPQLGVALTKETVAQGNQQDAIGRLRDLVRNTPESELSRLSLRDLSKMLHCCERHTSRLFREEFGTGFVNYVSELRLKKACDLLLKSNSKIIDVALESGHGSLAHFSFVFKKRFSVTPKEWRRTHRQQTRRSVRADVMPLITAVMVILFSVLGSPKGVGAPASTNSSATPGQAVTNRATTNAPAPRVLKFNVDHYEVTGNTVLSPNVISKVLAPFTGQDVDIGRITNAMAALQAEYFQRGYVTAKVSVPPQSITNRTIQFNVLEGKVTAVKVLHNHFFSSNNIMRTLPYVKTLVSSNRMLNAKVFQTELDRANSNPDRQISPEVRAGLEPGTSALILDVKDRLPMHGRLEFDNYSPPGTPELRLNANGSYGNLWDLDHSLGLQYGFSPDKMKPSMDRTHLLLADIDSPEVAYYSGFYRAPLGAPEAVEKQIAENRNAFGYNETTKQFVPPPATGRPEFTAYASRSTTGPTMDGPTTTVVNTSLLQIQQQMISQQYTSQTTAGGRLTIPLPEWEDIQSSWSIGMDYKSDKVVSLPTNYFYYTTIVTHGNGSSTPPTITKSTVAIAGTATYPSLNYTPLFLGWTGSRQDHWLQFGTAGNRANQMNAGVSVVAGAGGLFAGRRTFPSLISNSKDATTAFFAIRPQLSRLQTLPHNFSLYANVSGQWANEPLLNLEQLELGGNGSIRGYREGELYADAGWIGQLELRSPVYWRGGSKRIGTQLTAFADYGEGYTLDVASGKSSQSLSGVGAGVNFNLGPWLESHVLLAWPLMDSAFSRAGRLRISFSISAQL
jgi:hemolysin activation/secretion protein/AraC-like DNA-binding protein